MKGTARVQTALETAGLQINIVELQESARTAQLAADALGTGLGSIVKSLIFLADGEPTLVLVAGDRRADSAKLKMLLGARRVMIADAERVRQETGFSIGGVPPTGHQRPLPTWIDESLDPPTFNPQPDRPPTGGSVACHLRRPRTKPRQPFLGQLVPAAGRWGTA